MDSQLWTQRLEECRREGESKCDSVYLRGKTSACVSPRMGKGEREYNHICFQQLKHRNSFGFLCISTDNPSILLLMLSSEKPSSLPVFCNIFELDTCNEYHPVVAYQDYFRVMVSLNLLAFMWKGLRSLARGCSG